jgi:hypothetical protein
MCVKNCIRCRAEIPAERVEALPETELCIQCSEAVGSDFIYFATNDRTSKPGSMKLNYGGVTVKRVRRYIPPL